MTTIPEDLKATLQTHAFTLLHGNDDASWKAYQAMVEPIEDPLSFGVVAAFLASICGQAIREQRDRVTKPWSRRKMRGAMFASFPTEDLSAPHAATSQIVVAAANEDFPMVGALIRPWALGDTHNPEDTASLLTNLAMNARVMHRTICDGDDH